MRQLSEQRDYSFAGKPSLPRWTSVLHFANIFALRELLFVANFNDTFVSLVAACIYKMRANNFLLRPFSWSHLNSELQVQIERSRH
jgi:hypothetical protein